MNHQHALMKPYFDAGLKELAKVARYPIGAIKFLRKDTPLYYGNREAVYRSIMSTCFETNPVQINFRHYC